MTKTEAMEILTEVQVMDDSMYAYNPKYNEALDMAIEALKAQEPREIPPAQWDAWKDDAWAENLETGEITAINRTAVAAWVKYIRHDSYAHWKLWTGRPKGNE